MQSIRSWIARGAVVATLAAAAGVLAAPASALTFNVINTNDSGPGSLRQALADAAANAGDDDVVIQAGLGTITLASEIEWSGSGVVTIQGNGVTIDFNGASRGLVDDGGSGVSIINATVTGVAGSTSSDAGAVVSQGGPMSFADCTISGNTVQTDDGDVAGGILSEGGAVSVNNCTISANSGTTTTGDAGGGILSEGGAVAVNNSSIICNSASTSAEGGDAAGGILSEGGALSVTDSTVQGNTAQATGEGGVAENQLRADGGALDTTGSTVSDDTSICDAPPAPPPAPTGPPEVAPPAPAAVVAQPRFTG